MAAQQETFSRPTPAHAEKRKSKRALAASMLAAAVISAFITFLLTHHLDQDAARQARATQHAAVVRQQLTRQAQAAGQLEKAAATLYQSTASVYRYQVNCAEAGRTWPVCAALDPRLGDFSATTATFDTDRFALADAAATRLTTQFAHFSIGAVEASSAVGAQRQWTSMVTAYLDLIKRCGQLIRG
jgi:hypothetical protein